MKQFNTLLEQSVAKKNYLQQNNISEPSSNKEIQLKYGLISLCDQNCGVRSKREQTDGRKTNGKQGDHDDAREITTV